MFQLSESDQQLLLRLARGAVRAYLDGKQPILPDITSGGLVEPHGLFVSIHKETQLRGCIGNVEPVGPLFKSAMECAISAATGDPRFIPVTPAEFDDLLFEISVLSAMQRVVRFEDIEIGRHGLMISKQGVRGLLLPQVATAYGWTVERFLGETCRKAGLGPNEWQNGATVFRFDALVFGEKQLHGTATT